MNNLDYIFEFFKKEHGCNAMLTDICEEISKKTGLSYYTTYRMLRKKDFTFTQNVISLINENYPSFDYNKALKK